MENQAIRITNYAELTRLIKQKEINPKKAASMKKEFKSWTTFGKDRGGKYISIYQYSTYLDKHVFFNCIEYEAYEITGNTPHFANTLGYVNIS